MIAYPSRLERRMDRMVIYREGESDDPYGDDTLTKVGEAKVVIYSPQAETSTNPEGRAVGASMSGITFPDEGDPIRVGDQLRLAADTSRRYDVEGKVGLPSDIDPDLYRFQLSRANSA